jgi:hypothetical protein
MYEFFQAKLPGKNWLKFGKNNDDNDDDCDDK